MSPIGQPGSDGHRASSQVLEQLIRPVAEHAGYTVVRADEIHNTGPFLREVLRYLADANVVVADLTGRNANVFYELGVRHALSRRTILIARAQDDIPADLGHYRTLIYGDLLSHLDDLHLRLTKAFASILERPEETDSPVLEWLMRSPIPDELRRTYSARVADIGGTQEDILRFVRKRTRDHAVVSQHDIAAEFKRDGPEMYYRLEQLRLLGLITKRWNADTNDFVYALAPDYRRELGLH